MLSTKLDRLKQFAKLNHYHLLLRMEWVWCNGFSLKNVVTLEAAGPSCPLQEISSRDCDLDNAIEEVFIKIQKYNQKQESLKLKELDDAINQ